MPVISMPSIPQISGAPAVIRDLVLPVSKEPIPLEISYLTDLIFGVPKWGFFDENDNQVLIFDSFLGMRFRESSKISTFSVEQGTFSSFNKVGMPFDVVISVAHSGNFNTRSTMLDTLQKIKNDLKIYSVVTPEKTYSSVNLVAYSYERNSRTGPGQLVVDLYLEEVRQIANADFNDTVMPDSAEEKSNGQVQIFPINPPKKNLVQ